MDIMVAVVLMVQHGLVVAAAVLVVLVILIQIIVMLEMVEMDNLSQHILLLFFKLEFQRVHGLALVQH